MFQWLMPNEEGFLEAEGFEKTWRITQQSLLNEVDANSSRKAFDMILPGKADNLCFYLIFFFSIITKK